MQVAPVEAMGRGACEHHARLHMRRDLLWAIVVAIAAIAVSRVRPIDGRPIAGYIATLLAIVSMALAAPAVITGLAAVTRTASRARASSWLNAYSVNSASRFPAGAKSAVKNRSGSCRRTSSPTWLRPREAPFMRTCLTHWRARS